jgi:hypothetical protein
MKQEASDQLSALIHEVFNGLRSNPVVRKISAVQIAEAVYLKLDPATLAPFLVRFTSKCDLQQRVRAQCRERLQKEQDEVAQTSMFDLQEWYPTFEESGPGDYVRREDMTYEQRFANIRRLRSTGRGYLAHADALEAETNLLISEGKLKPRAMPKPVSESAEQQLPL